jgi:siroheme synthase
VDGCGGGKPDDASMCRAQGHSRVGGEDPLDEIAARADERTTLIIYMGLAALPQLAQRLRDKGLPDDLPAVAVMKGTTANQVRIPGN